MSEFKERLDLVNQLLSKNGLDFKDNLAEEDRKALVIKRKEFVLKARYISMSISKLKTLLENT